MRTFHPLESAKGKIDRAQEHLECLESAIKKFCGHQRRVIRKDDSERGLYTLEFVFPDIDWRTAYIVGDIVSCLRASLDHTTWALSYEGLKRTKFPPKSIKFPIFDEFNTENSKSFRQSLRHVDPKAVEIIESFQPYNQGTSAKESLLSQLNALCNADKHRHVTIRRTTIKVNFPDFPLRHRGAIQVLDNSDEHSVVAVPLALKKYMEFNPDASLDVVFGDVLVEDMAVPRQRLRQIYEFVSESVIPRFTRFFK